MYQPRHRREKRREHDAGRAAVERNCARDERDDAVERRWRRETRKKIGEERHAARRLEQGDERADAGHHQNRAPWNARDRASFLGRARPEQQNRCEECAEAGV